MEKKTFGVVLSPIVWSLLSVVFGVLMIVYSGRILDWVMVFAGAYLIVFGAVPLIRALIVHEPFPMVSMLSVLCGILLVLFHSALTAIMFVLLGLLLFLVGMQQLNHFLSMRRVGIRVAWYCYLYPVLAILAGVIAVWDPFRLPETLIAFVGWCLAAHGVISIVGILVAMYAFSHATIEDAGEDASDASDASIEDSTDKHNAPPLNS